MSPDRTQAAALVLALAALLAAGRWAAVIGERRTALRLAPPPAELRAIGGGPDALIVALGSFRGLAATMLWFRAQDLERDGRYHESIELARVVARLQPRMWAVRAFLAHNLAFNMSRAMERPQDRWTWVEAGLRLMREGLARTPHTTPLYVELAQMMSVKLLGGADDAEDHYRRQLARRWHHVLGSPPRELTAWNHWLDPLVEAPHSLDELVIATPAVGPLLIQLRALGQPLDRALLERVAALDLTSELAELGQEGAEQRLSAQAALRRALAVDPAARSALLAYLRAAAVRQEGLDPARMRALTRELGPLDWRHPAAHVLYWTRLGLELGQPEPRDSPEQLELQRNALGRLEVDSLRHLVREGSLTLDGERPVSWPNLGLLDAFIRAAREQRDRIPLEDPTPRQRMDETIGGMLAWGAREALASGDRALAQRYYEELQRSLPWTMSLDAFFWVVGRSGELRPGMTDREALRHIRPLFVRAVELGLAEGESARAEALLERATELLQFLREHSPSQEVPEARDLMVQAFSRYLAAPGPDLLRRSRAWRNAPLWLRHAVYPAVREALAEQCAAHGLIAERAFPPPD